MSDDNPEEDDENSEIQKTQKSTLEFQASKLKTTGRVKFFMESDNYGFIISDKSADADAGEDIFFHFDDIKRTNLSRAFLKQVRDQFLVKVRFRVMAYQGKYSQSKKAVDIDLIKIDPLNIGSVG